MDTIDRELIALLRDNARTPVLTLAKKLKVARATVHNRITRLEEQGVIIGYTVRLRSDALDQGVRAITSIGISGHHAAEVKHALRGHPNVVAIHTTNGRWDLMAELRADTLEAFDRALNAIRSIDPAYREHRDQHPAFDLQDVTAEPGLLPGVLHKKLPALLQSVCSLPALQGWRSATARNVRNVTTGVSTTNRLASHPGTSPAGAACNW